MKNNAARKLLLKREPGKKRLGTVRRCDRSEKTSTGAIDLQPNRYYERVMHLLDLWCRV